VVGCDAHPRDVVDCLSVILPGPAARVDASAGAVAMDRSGGLCCLVPERGDELCPTRNLTAVSRYHFDEEAVRVLPGASP
jgi:hypothetical protein